MATTSQVHNYLNTLIFCIIAKIVSILLLIALFVNRYLLENWSYTVLTIVLGFIVIIIWSMLSIISYSNRAKKANEQAANDLLKRAQQQCPNYFVKTVDDNGETLCDNTYASPNEGSSIRFMDSNLSMLPSFSNVLFASESNISVDVMCQAVTNPNWEFANYPFTDIKEFCRVMV